MFCKKIHRNIMGMILIIGMVLYCTTYSVHAAPMLLNYDGKTHVYEGQPIHLLVDGNELLDLPMPPILFNDTTLVPAREVFEALGAVVDWKMESHEIFIGYEETIIILQINNPIANVNGRELEMAVPPLIINDKTMIPVRFPAESLGFQVDWIGEERSIHIGKSVLRTPPQSDNTLEQAASQIVDDIAPEEPMRDNTLAGGEVSSLLPGLGETQSQTGLAKDISTSGITPADYPETKISKITLPQSGLADGFSIEANSAISRVDKLLMPDNRLVLDIYNAECALSKEYTLADNPAIAKVRAAQNQVMPVKITRVVFELRTAVNYSVQLSPDRMVINISFEKNTVTGVQFSSDESGDYVNITFQRPHSIDVYPLTGPDRVVIDLPYCNMAQISDQTVVGRFASAVRASQFTESMGRVVIDLKELAKYDVTYESNAARIKLTAVTFKNIGYNSETNTIIVKKAGYPITIESILHNDQYLSSQYTCTLPGNFEGMLGYGEYMIKDEMVNSIVIETVGNNTSIIINQRQVLAYDISMDNSFMYIRAMYPREKYPRIVIVDPGHGAEDGGASKYGILEKNINLDIALRLVDLIEQGGTMKAYATRLADVKPSRPERASFANRLGDMFISIHINSAENNAVANGTEVYYYAHSNDAEIGLPSQKLAGIIQKNLVNELGSLDRKIKTEPYDVLTLTQIPAVLCEIGFISNQEEASKLNTEMYRQRAAQGIYNGLIEIFQSYTPMR